MRRHELLLAALTCGLSLVTAPTARAADSPNGSKVAESSKSAKPHDSARKPTTGELAKDSKGEQAPNVSALRRIIEEQAELIRLLTSRVDLLEKRNGGSPEIATTAHATARKTVQDPPIPAVELPGDKPGGKPQNPPQEQVPPIPEVGINQPGQAQTPFRASLLPDISVIGNNLGRFISVSGDSDRNRFQLGEFEIGLQQPILPGVRFDAFLAGGADEGFGIAAEEAFVTFSKIGHLPFGGYLGQKRLNFGKINAVHPHSRNYADQPAPLANLLGGEALAGNGASVTYLFPFKNLFANLELGLWSTRPGEDGITVGDDPNTTFYPSGAGIHGSFPMARLWLSKEIGKSGEFELGTSHGYGKSDMGDNIRLSGVDFTFRRFPSTFKRLMLQGELFWHNRDDRVGGTGKHTRSGYYLLGMWRPDQYKEYGIRYDNSRFPWPIDGKDRSLSLIWTDKLTEVTLLRLQLKHGDRTSDVFLPAKKGYTEGWLQFIWGAGPHGHSLQ